MLRFFEGLEVSEVARRLGAPEPTIRSRLTRGLALLREDLDAKHGDRAEWKHALVLAYSLPVDASGRATTASSAAGTKSAGTKSGTAGSGVPWGALATAAIVLVGLAVGGWFFDRASRTASDDTTAGETSVDDGATARVDRGSERRADEAEGGLTVTASTTDVDTTTPSTGGSESRLASSFSGRSFEVTGRVVDFEGRGVAGLALQLQATAFAHQPEAARAASGIVRNAITAADGSFTIEVVRGNEHLTLGVESDAWVTLYSAELGLDAAEKTHTIVAVGRVQIEGQIVHPDGRPVAKARVYSNHMRSLETLFDLEIEGERYRANQPMAQTDREGRFVLAAPAVPGGEITVQKLGYRTHAVATPSVGDHRPVWTLTPIPAGLTVKIRGRVIDDAGNGVADARVSLSDDGATTDDHGAYELVVEPEMVKRCPDEAPLFAHYGGAVSVAPSIGLRIRDATDGELNVDFTLRSADRVLRGRLTDGEGATAAGWEVSIHDPTELTWDRMPPSIAERYPASWTPHTSEYGDFEIAGLLPREYSLRFIHPETLASFVAGPFAAEEPRQEPFDVEDLGYEIAIPDDILYSRVRGRVIDREGQPLSEVSVRLNVLTYERNRMRSHRTGPRTESDGNGWFEFDNVPRRATFLVISGEGVTSRSVRLEEIDPHSEIELVVDRTARFRYREDADRDDLGRNIRALDADGKLLKMYRHSGGSSTSGNTMQLHHGASGWLEVSEAVRVLQIYGARGKLREEIPLRLRAGEEREIER